MQFTDVNIDSLHIASLGPDFSQFPNNEQILTERTTMLLKRHTPLNADG